MMDKPIVINVVSGKGGTGKTLLTAVLAEMLGNNSYNVVVVDMDVFVRGLTSLLYFHKKETIKLTKDDELTISQIFIDKGDFEISGFTKFSISRYRSFDVIPSVSRVDELLEFKDLMPDTKEEAKDIVHAILNKIPNTYDIVLLDSRAGYDELISATHVWSDITICVEEEDDISKITSDNLIKQLKADADVPLFRITNKARAMKPYEDIHPSGGISQLGNIPFDMDVMRSFGRQSFWTEINQTLYKSALSQAWNKLSNRMELGMNIDFTRTSPLGSEAFERKLQLYSITDRVFILYGLLIGFIGTLYGFLGVEGFSKIISNERSLALSIGILGFAFTTFILLRKKRN